MIQNIFLDIIDIVILLVSHYNSTDAAKYNVVVLLTLPIM